MANFSNNNEVKRVLSIQSHVVHGYVGNKSATFPLQVLGFEVDCINSVQFCNHTGYKHFKGQILEEKELYDLFEGLEQNDLLKGYTHLLTGYIGSESFLKKVVKIIVKMKKLNPNLIYVCDPVMGDDGKMYVPKELLPIYRDEVIPLANIVTPNQFEMELLTNQKVHNINDVWDSLNWFHLKNVNIVALSSSELGGRHEILAFLSKMGEIKCSINVPRQGKGCSFTGTGDLFAALFLAQSYMNSNLVIAFERTINTLQAVIKRTVESFPEEVLSGKRNLLPQDKELKLIQSKTDIENPECLLKANPTETS